MGAFWQVFVIFGVHWGFVPVMIQDLSDAGLLAAHRPAVRRGARPGRCRCCAVFLKTRNRELKEVAGPATISAFLAGITEPAIYGVTLRLKKPFIYACIGGAVGGAIAAAGGSAAEGFVLPGAITLTSTMNIGNFTLQLIGTGLAIAIAFVLTMVARLQGHPRDQARRRRPRPPPTRASCPPRPLAIAAPVAGTVVPLAAVPDKVFSSGAMGTGLAVIPTEGKAYAPVSGTLVTVMPHAYGITADNGLEVLVHVGLDTVELDGKHFTPKVAKGQRVTAGQLLVEFDIAAITAAGYNPMTVMVVTNSGDYAAVVPIAEGDVSAARARARRRRLTQTGVGWLQDTIPASPPAPTRSTRPQPATTRESENHR